MTARHHAFPPVVDVDTRVLILGSLPGAASLAAGQYYAHPRNGFWLLASGLAGRDLGPLPYPDRLAALRAARIGLWDVVASAERPGSLDSAIRDPMLADVPALVASLPRLRAIGFNGAKAAQLGRRQLAGRIRPGIALIDLPSSSPALARPFAEKQVAWSVLTQHLVATDS